MKFHIIESKHYPELHAPCEGAYDVGFELKPWEDEDTVGNDRRWRVDVDTLAELDADEDASPQLRIARKKRECQQVIKDARAELRRLERIEKNMGGEHGES